MLSEVFNVEKALDICNKIWYFFVINLLFVISNFPILLVILFVGMDQLRTYLPLVFLALTAMAPALSAVLYAMNRLLAGTERGAWKDYWKGYRSGFWQKLRLGFVHMFILLVFWTNIEFFTLQMPFLPLAILFFLLFAAAVLVTPELYLFASRYEMTNLQLARTAVVVSIARPVVTLGNAAAFALMLAAFEMFAGTTVLFMGSVYGFLVVFMNRKILESLENQE